MEKKTYYVSIDLGPYAGEIRDQPDPTDPVFDFEIQATSEEIQKLEHLFSEIAEEDYDTFIQAHLPYRTEERMEEHNYDDRIKAVYQLIYHLGTKETKKRMKESGMII
ncbi:hypothetical protein [Thermoflavimicrobium dichotomicum]|uniref:Hydrolase n=1 Tax=Thermoflavimicrobium dichotomicum TaxID=46223 RepID=A0A1I3TRK0_9BACL|nr:hypothetical protein [Thermoflavimicrobium dichotomicum]SFJ73222.1 hypothetical protein SAMN05421852_11936 [Thermoflavimicrobium dichotomicum]